MKKKKIILFSAIGLLTICLATFFIYVSIYYHATSEVEEFLVSNDKVEVIEEGNITFKPKNEINGGIIFYPGAKVEHKAYSELMFRLAEEGYLCVLVKMPFNLAFFGMNKVDGIIEEYSDIDNWHLMGHSLGGAMISSYASKNIDKVDSVILLAAYSTADISQVNVISIYGSNDMVLSKDKYEENKKNLPKDFYEFIIDGGNHANFASYGEQKGDGKSEFSTKKQVEITVNEIIKFLNSII